MTAYAGHGIFSYSGRSDGGDGAPLLPASPDNAFLCAPAPAGRRSLLQSGASMSALDLFLPLAKVDLDRRLVTGVATAETPDRSGEIFDYASSKPYFEKWSAEAAAASGGKSLGAVRAMHTPIAAGKLTDIAFDDDAKRITVVRQDRRRRRMAKGSGRRLHRLQPGRTLCEAVGGRRQRTHPLYRRAARNLARRSALRARRDVRRGQGRHDRKTRVSLLAPRRATPRWTMASTATTRISTPTRASSRPRSVRKTPKRASPCPTAPIRSGPPRTSRTP